VKKLSRIFQTKKGALYEAVREDDTALMEKLMGKKSDFLIFEIFNPRVVDGMTPRMADTIVGYLAAGNDIRWGISGRDDRLVVPVMLAASALGEKNYALADVFLDGRLDYCSGKFSTAFVSDMLNSDIDADKKTQYLKKILSVGGKLPEPEKAVRAAVDNSALGALDVLAASGINLRENNECWLREAAKNDKRHVCLHLVENHGADLALAMKTAQDLGTHNVYLYLDNLRQDIQPRTAAEDAPSTVESLSREVKELRAALREVTALVADMQSERKVEKTLDKPGLHAKGYNR